MQEDKGHQERPISRVANTKYRTNWDKIFKKKSTKDKSNEKSS